MLVGTKPREMSGKVFKSDPDRAFGRESRSLKACYELYEVGGVGLIATRGFECTVAVLYASCTMRDQLFAICLMVKQKIAVLQAGYKNIVHVDGGFPQWRYDQLPTEAEG